MDILKAIGIALLAGAGGYILGFILGMLAVNSFSSNSHDKSLEAAMTGAFFVGPVVAVLGMVVGLALYWYFTQG